MIVTVVGARPNYMKAAPIHEAFLRAGVRHQLIHTGQHYDDAMSKVFFDDLGMPRPSLNLGVGSGSHAEQTGAVMVGLEKHFTVSKPDGVLVVGDINSTMAAAIVCAKMGIFVAHVEAGLRSQDWTMPEEINRVITDSICDLLLTPSIDANENLAREGCDPDSIVLVGNVMIDTLLQHLPRAQTLDVPHRLGLHPGQYAVATLHRPSNVDNATALRGILEALASISKRLPVIFSVHPRTLRRIHEDGLGDLIQKHPGFMTCSPLGYLDFLCLTSHARLILTDSGGLQEESTALGIPCLTLRKNTERPITISEGSNHLAGNDQTSILNCAEQALADRTAIRQRPQLWDGKAADRIVKTIKERLYAPAFSPLS